jgi:hypothetical protein
MTFTIKYRIVKIGEDYKHFRPDRDIIAEKYKVQDGLIIFIEDGMLVHAVTAEEIFEIVTSNEPPRDTQSTND